MTPWLRPSGLFNRMVPFLGLGEIKPDAGVGVFTWRLPMNKMVALEESRSLVDGTMVGGARSGFIVTDARGSVLRETDMQAVPTSAEAADYEAWGDMNVAPGGNAPLPEHGFVGAEKDPAFGLYTFGVRAYDPTMKAFLSPEPEWLSQGPMVSTRTSMRRTTRSDSSTVMAECSLSSATSQRLLRL